jgi:hypothetical protein
MKMMPGILKRTGEPTMPRKFTIRTFFLYIESGTAHIAVPFLNRFNT